MYSNRSFNLVLTLITGIFLLLLSSCKTNPPSAPGNIFEFGKVFVSSGNVIDAKIWLDGNDTGKLTPDTIEAKTGIHLVSLSKDFFFRESLSVEIIKDIVVDLQFTLNEIPDIGEV